MNKMIHLHIKKYKIEDILELIFLLILGLFFIYYFLKVTTFEITWSVYIMQHLRTIIIVIAVLRIFLLKRELRIIEILLIGMSIFAFYEAFFHIESSYRDEMLNVIILMVGCFDIPYQKIVKTYFITTATVYIFTVANALLGNIENGVVYRYVNGEAVKARYLLGMLQHAYLNICLFYIVSAYLILRSIKISYLELAIIELINIFIYHLGGARNHFICINVLIIGVAWLKISVKKKNTIDYQPSTLFSIICCYSAIISAVFSFLTGFFYSPKVKWMAAINSIISDRLYYSKITFDRIGLSLWGRDIANRSKALNVTEIAESNFYVLDNQYVRLVILYGIVFFGVVMLLLYFLHYKVFTSKQWVMSLICAINSIQFIIDQDMFMINGNFLILCVFALFPPESIQLTEDEINDEVRSDV